MDIAKCLEVFGLLKDDQLILIKEQHLAEANFVISYLMKQILDDEHNQLLLIVTRNSLAHYECVSKRLAYSLMHSISEKRVHVIDFQAIAFRALSIANEHQSDEAASNVLHELIEQMRKVVDDFVDLESNGKFFIVFDDVSNIYDYCSQLDKSVNFLNCFLGHYFNDSNICYILSMHVGAGNAQILSRDLEYSATGIIDVSLLKTGRSNDISGVLKTVRHRNTSIYHFKIREYGVDLYKPGDIWF